MFLWLGRIKLRRNLTFEEFHDKVLGPTKERSTDYGQGFWLLLKYHDSTLLCTCNHLAIRHGVPGDEGCGEAGCPCKYYWVSAGLAGLGLPLDYVFYEKPEALLKEEKP